MDEPATRLRLLDNVGFAAYIDQAASIYGAAMGRTPATTAARRDLIQTHLSRPGFAAVTASIDGDELDGQGVVGFGYGYHGHGGQWWHDVVAGAIGTTASATWLADAFELAELHVAPDHHGHGTGRRVLELLLANVPGATVVLSTHDRESPARGLYRSLGFIDLLEHFCFPGSAEVYAIMGLQRG